MARAIHVRLTTWSEKALQGSSLDEVSGNLKLLHPNSQRYPSGDVNMGPELNGGTNYNNHARDPQTVLQKEKKRARVVPAPGRERGDNNFLRLGTH